jgi:alpha-tubulin suppressor-like RCC1 family protein
MIPITPLLTCANTAITNLTAACSAQTFLQLSSIAKDAANSYAYSVADIASLPDATCNKGRLVYVQDRCSYRFSDGTQWTNDVSSVSSLGVALSWGGATYGRLGDGTTVTKCSPVSVIGGFTDWCQVAGGYQHGVALRTNGTAWAWGRNQLGQLGDGTTINRSSPVSVIGGFTNWCQIVGGYRHTTALRANGTIWSWGSNNYSQLGDGTNISKSSPVSVIGGFTDWCQVSTNAGNHVVALRTNGTLWAWGAGYNGQLGNGNVNTQSSPVSVVGGFTDWSRVSAGGSGFTLAIRTNGTAWTWGNNINGQLGNGTTTTTSSPVSVIGGFTDWCQVSAGWRHVIAVRTNGTLWAWGGNAAGALGDGTTVNKSSPVSVIGGFTNWCAASAGARHSLGIRTNGTAWAWGENNSGQLGDNTGTATSSPISVIGGNTNWYQVFGSYRSTLAIRTTKGF